MGRIQSSVGLVTGVAIEETVNQLIQLNALPRQRLESRNALLEREQVAIAELTALVVGVQLSTDRLGQSTLFSATSVTSSNKDALAVRSSGAPTPGNYSFIPVRQAQNQQLTSSLFSSSDYKLNEGEIVINTGGFLDSSISLDELNGGEGVSRGYLRITDKSGTSQSVDLRFAQDAQDVVDAINATDNLGVVASIDGDHFVLTDVSGGNVGNLSVSEVSGGTTASDLGLAGISTASNTASGTSVQALTAATGLSRLLDNRGLDIPTNGVALQFQLQDGSSVDLNTKLISNTASLGQLIDEINDAGDGKLQASISASGKTIEIQDLTSGTATFSVSSPAGTLAEQLGLDNASVGGLITSDRLIAGLSDVLLSSLGGGQGLGTLGQIAITDRSGASDTIDLSSATTLDDVINAFNESSVSVTAQLNRTKTGIELIDTTGATASDLIIANADATNSATALQLESSSASVRIDSGSLNLQFVTNNTKIADFNQGRGVRFGSIQFTDSTGETSAINLATLNPTTIGDVVNKINKLGIGVSASINETGDGLLLVDTAGGSGTLKVEDINGGSAALDLGIAGTATTLNVNGQEESGIDGSLTIRIKTDAETTLADLAEKINALEGSPVSASILNLNASGGVRLLLNSNASGSQGRVTIAGEVGIGFSETSEGRDALLAFGANESSGGVLVSSSSNDFTGLVDDLEFTITGTSTTPVTVSFSQSDDKITSQIEALVTQYNKVRDKFQEVTRFDEATQSVGILFGKSIAIRIDQSFGRLFSGSFRGAGAVGSLGQLGIRLNESGKLEFDKAKFDEAYQADPAAVEEFFTAEDTGFSAKAASVADSLAGVDSGALLGRSDTLAQQIEQNAKRITAMNVRLDKQRTRLLNQFYNMETAIAKLQRNLTAVNQLQIVPPLGSSSSS